MLDDHLLGAPDVRDLSRRGREVDKVPDAASQAWRRGRRLAGPSLNHNS